MEKEAEEELPKSPGQELPRSPRKRARAGALSQLYLLIAHHNRTIAIASDFRVDGAKSPEIPQKEGVLGLEIAARNRR